MDRTEILASAAAPVRAAVWSWPHHLAAGAVVLAIALAPLLLVTLPPLVDYPNHLARMHLLYETAAGDVVRQFYQPAWAPLPNLAMEAVMPLLLAFTDLEQAGRLFVALLLALTAGGAAALHYALHRRLSPWPWVVALLLYNRILLWGFLNYLFALALALWLLALWIGLRDRLGWRQVALFSVGATLLLYAHLFAFGFYALCVGACELGRLQRPAAWRAALKPMLHLLPPLTLFLWLSPTREAATLFEYGPWLRKVAALASLFNNYERSLDAATLLFAGALLALGLARGALVIHRAMRLPLLLLGVTFLLMPGTVLTSQGADTRFAIAIALLFVAATDLHLANPALRRTLGLALLALFVARMTVVAHHWRAAEPLQQEFTRAFAALPAGSRLYPIDLQPAGWNPFPVPTAHLACLAVTRDVFVPTVFAFPTQQPLRVTPEFRALAQLAPTSAVVRDLRQVPWAQVIGGYTHVLLMERGTDGALPGLPLVLERATPAFRLFRITSPNPTEGATS